MRKRDHLKAMKTLKNTTIADPQMNSPAVVPILDLEGVLGVSGNGVFGVSSTMPERDKEFVGYFFRRMDALATFSTIFTRKTTSCSLFCTPSPSEKGSSLKRKWLL